MGNHLVVGSAGIFSDKTWMTAAGSRAAGNKAQNKQESKGQGNTIFMGGLRQNRDIISEKFAMAQKKALKRVLDQFKEDIKLDEDMAQRSAHVGELRDEAHMAFDQLKEIDARRNELKEQYGIDPNSQEQKDLELRQKANAAEKDPFNKEYMLTEEEKQRLSEMPPLTDYQKDMLECDEAEDKYREILSNSRRDIEVEKATIEATKKALLKVSPMVDARREADEIMENAYKEQIGALFQEVVDKIDEDMAEMKEAIDENREEALEEKIQREKMKKEEAEREAAREEMQDTILSAASPVLSSNQQAIEQLQADIKSLIQDQIVLDVDMKGLRVNEQI